MESPTLSTMVVLYNTTLKFDTSKLLETLPLNEMIIKIEKRGLPRRGESKRDKIKRRSKKEQSSSNTGFCNNSLTLVMLSNGDGSLLQKEITVKIFQNGVFHMTGVLHELYHRTCMAYLMAAIYDNCKLALKEGSQFGITKCRVVLMNYTTQLSSKDTIAREILHNKIRAMKSDIIHSHYDPDVYPGVKINIGPGKWTAKIFRTGKIILTGVTEHSECLEFMKQLQMLFDSVLPQKTKLGSMSNRADQLLMR